VSLSVGLLQGKGEKYQLTAASVERKSQMFLSEKQRGPITTHSPEERAVRSMDIVAAPLRGLRSRLNFRPLVYGKKIL